jgi:hypothetical protein
MDQPYLHHTQNDSLPLKILLYNINNMSFVSDTLSYLRLKKHNKVDELCSDPSKHLSDDEIKPFVYPQEFTKTKSKNNRLRKYFKDNCEELVNSYYDKEYKSSAADRMVKMMVPTYVKHSSKLLENIINIMLYAPLNVVSWSSYLKISPEGRNIFANLFLKRKYSIAFANLFVIFLTVYIKSGYDDEFFRKEFFSFLPNIEELIKGTILENVFLRFMASQITTKTFLYLYYKIFMKDEPTEIEEDYMTDLIIEKLDKIPDFLKTK